MAKVINFIHTADIHLDMPFSSLGNDRAEKRREELLHSLYGIVNRAKASDVELLLICGDLYEQSNIKQSTINTIKNMFSELYNTQIVICPGNHDYYTIQSPYQKLLQLENVHILCHDTPYILLDKLGVCVYGLGMQGDVRGDIRSLQLQNVDAGLFNIISLHGTVDLPFEQQNYNSISSKELFSLNMDYIAIGHIHRHYFVKGEKGLLINAGSLEPLGFDEEGHHGYVEGKLILDDNGQKNVDWSFIASAKRHYHNIEIDINDCTDNQMCLERVQRFITSQEDLYNIVLNGFVDEKFTPDIGQLLIALEKQAFYIRIKNNTSAKFSYEDYIEDPGIKGEFVRILVDMLEAELDTDKRETIEMAIQFGLQAMEQGRID